MDPNLFNYGIVLEAYTDLRNHDTAPCRVRNELIVTEATSWARRGGRSVYMCQDIVAPVLYFWIMTEAYPKNDLEPRLAVFLESIREFRAAV